MQEQLFSVLKRYCLPGFVVAISFIYQLTPLNNLLDFERTEIRNGQWWLLVTGHFCHLSWTHWLLNNVALVIIWELFYRATPIIKASTELLLLCLCVSAGIFWFNSDVEWYVGLSGVLHGLFTIGVLREIFLGHKLSIVIGIVLVGKLVWEQTVGITTSFFFNPDEVLVDAHLYGAVGGLVIAAAYHAFDVVTGGNKLSEPSP